MNWTFLRRLLLSPQTICLLFIALSGLYSIITPIFEASDELWHYPYIKNIADGNGLPVQSPGSEKNYWQQEGSQPPLYYLIGALATFWIDTGDIDSIYWRNPHATIGAPNADDNKNMVVHTEAEAFPYRGVPLAVHMLRFLSVLMGAGTVCITYLLTLELFPGVRRLALSTALINALIPEFLFISGAINNDNLITLLSSLALLLIVRALKQGLDRRSAIVLSVVVGLAIISKLSGLALLGLVCAASVIDAIKRKSYRLVIKWTGPVAIGAVVIGGWWYLRNWLLYGDFLGLNVWLKIVGERSDKPGIIDLVLSEFQGFRMSFWAVFGGFNVLADAPVYWFYDGITVVSLAGLMTIIIRRRRSLSKEAPFILVCAAWMVLLGASLIRWTSMTLASQGRLMFPAISVASIALFLGIRAVVPQKFITVLTICLGIGMFAIAVSVPFRNISQAYPKPLLLKEQDLAGSIQPLNINFEGKAELLGYRISKAKFDPGENLEITLFWKSLSELDENYSVFVHLFGKDDEPIGQSDSYPSGGAYATRLWRPGDVISDRHKVTINAAASTPSVGRIRAGMYILPSFRTLQATDALGRPIGPSPSIATVKLVGNNRKPVGELAELASFEHRIALVGVDLPRTEVAPGEKLSGSLVWWAKDSISEDYTVFVQLIGRDGLIAQYDSQPVRGYYPTSLWEIGEIIDDSFQIAISPDVQEGSYDLIAGLYRSDSGTRLRVNDGTFIKLERVTVQHAR